MSPLVKFGAVAIALLGVAVEKSECAGRETGSRGGVRTVTTTITR